MKQEYEKIDENILYIKNAAEKYKHIEVDDGFDF